MQNSVVSTGNGTTKLGEVIMKRNRMLISTSTDSRARKYHQYTCGKSKKAFLTLLHNQCFNKNFIYGCG
jgi:hypothetical protein